MCLRSTILKIDLSPGFSNTQRYISMVSIFKNKYKSREFFFKHPKKYIVQRNHHRLKFYTALYLRAPNFKFSATNIFKYTITWLKKCKKMC